MKYDYIDLIMAYMSLSYDEQVALWNEYCLDSGYENDVIHSSWDNVAEILTAPDADPIEAVKAFKWSTRFADFTQNYWYIDGCGNVRSMNNPNEFIGRGQLLEWLEENERLSDLGLEDFEDEYEDDDDEY